MRCPPRCHLVLFGPAMSCLWPRYSISVRGILPATGMPLLARVALPLAVVFCFWLADDIPSHIISCWRSSRCQPFNAGLQHPDCSCYIEFRSRLLAVGDVRLFWLAWPCPQPLNLCWPMASRLMLQSLACGSLSSNATRPASFTFVSCWLTALRSPHEAIILWLDAHAAFVAHAI